MARTIVSVCQNASCNSVGAAVLVRDIEELAHGNCDVEECACLGKCGMGPNVEVTGKDGIPIIHIGVLTFDRALEIVRGKAKTAVSDLVAQIGALKYEARRNPDSSSKMQQVQQCFQMIGPPADNQADEKDPLLRAELLVMRSNMLLETEPLRALHDAKEAVSLCPAWSQALLALAGALEATKKPEEALKLCEEIQKFGKCYSKSKLQRRMQRLKTKVDDPNAATDTSSTPAAEKAPKILNNNILRAFGGPKKFEELAHEVHEQLFIHPITSDFFPPTMDNSRITRRNAEFLIGAFGGPKYKGPDMIATHEFLRITDAQYDVMIDCFTQALTKMKSSPEHREVIMTQLEGMRYTIVFRKDRPKPLARKYAAYHKVHQKQKHDAGHKHGKQGDKKGAAAKPKVAAAPKKASVSKPQVEPEVRKSKTGDETETQTQWLDWRVGAISKLSQNTILLHARATTAPVNHSFACGDVWHNYIMKEDFGDSLIRSYTPISTVEDYKEGILEFVIKIYADGRMTQWLTTLAIGSILPISSPLKSLDPEQYTDGLVMIAGGSAVTVAAQICRAALKRCAAKSKDSFVRLLMCFRNIEDCVFAHIFDKLFAQYPNFQVAYFIEEGLPEMLPSQAATWNSGRISKDAFDPATLPLQVKGVVSGPVGLCRAVLDCWGNSGRKVADIKFLDGIAEPPPAEVAWRVSTVTKLNHDCIRILLKCPDESAVSSHPLSSKDTWHVDFVIDDGDDLVMRSYTPMSDSTEYRKGWLEFLIKIYPNGKMTQYLSKCAPGDMLSISAPISTVDPVTYLKGLFMISGGSAITVAIQLCKAILARRPSGTPVNLVVCNRTFEDALLLDILHDLQSKHATFSVIHCITEGLPDALPHGGRRCDKVPETMDSGVAYWRPGRIGGDVLEQVRPRISGVVSGPPGLCRAALDLWVASGRSQWTMNCLDAIGEPVEAPPVQAMTEAKEEIPVKKDMLIPHPKKNGNPASCPFMSLFSCSCSSADKESDVDGSVAAQFDESAPQPQARKPLAPTK